MIRFQVSTAPEDWAHCAPTKFSTEEAYAVVLADPSLLVFIETNKAVFFVKFGEHVTSHVCRDTVDRFSLRKHENVQIYIQYTNIYIIYKYSNTSLRGLERKIAKINKNKNAVEIQCHVRWFLSKQNKSLEKRCVCVCVYLNIQGVAAQTFRKGLMKVGKLLPISWSSLIVTIKPFSPLSLCKTNTHPHSDRVKPIPRHG